MKFRVVKHIRHIDTKEEYRDNWEGDKWDVYDVYECEYCDKKFTLDVDLSVQKELYERVYEHVGKKHPSEK